MNKHNIEVGDYILKEDLVRDFDTFQAVVKAFKEAGYSLYPVLYEGDDRENYEYIKSPHNGANKTYGVDYVDSVLLGGSLDSFKRQRDVNEFLPNKPYKPEQNTVCEYSLNEQEENMTPTKEQLADPKWWSDNDPSGGEATHYDLGDESSSAFYKNGKFWSDYSCEFVGGIDPYGELVPRPTQPQWTGPEDGLPPVGEKVLFDEFRNGIFREVMPKGFWTEDGNTSMWIVSVSIPNITPDQFRPVHTQAEIEREEVVESARDFLEKIGAARPSNVLYALYNDGRLRKPMSVSVTNVAEMAYMQGQIDQGIDPSHSGAKAYAQRLIKDLGYKE